MIQLEKQDTVEEKLLISLKKLEQEKHNVNEIIDEAIHLIRTILEQNEEQVVCSNCGCRVRKCALFCEQCGFDLKKGEEKMTDMDLFIMPENIL